MDTGQPPPFFLDTTTIPQSYNNHHHHTSSPSTSSSPTSSVIIVIIVISSAIILSATIYLFIRFLTRRCNQTNPFSPADDVVVVPNNIETLEHVRSHVISIPNNNNNNNNNGSNNSSLESLLPLFTFSSTVGKFEGGGDCAVCLSKFHGADLLRLLPFCCHAFHAECIDTWLKSNQTCPLCRSSVNPNESDIMNTVANNNNNNNNNNRSGSFRIEIGTISQRRDPANSDRRSYSVGSFDYVIDDGYEIPVESTHRSVTSDCTDKDSVTPEAPGEYLAADVAAGSGRFNWLRDYVDRVSTSLRGSGRFFTGSSRRSESETSHGRIGEEISELFRWLSGV